MNAMKLIVWAGLLFGLTGCGIADHFDAQAKMDTAEADYRKCLNDHIDRPELCENLRNVWVTDREDYDTGNY